MSGTSKDLSSNLTKISFSNGKFSVSNEIFGLIFVCLCFFVLYATLKSRSILL